MIAVIRAATAAADSDPTEVPMKHLTQAETAFANDATNTDLAATYPAGCAMAWFALKNLRGQDVTRDRVARLAAMPHHHTSPAVHSPPDRGHAAQTPDTPVNVIGAIDAERLTRVPLIRRAVNSCLGAMRSPDHGGDAA